jgi:hypothetical protein
VSGYARSLPHLGFDPAPGDVGLTRDLARRHHQVAQEVRQVLTLVHQVNLSSWRGRAGDAVQALRSTFPPALRSVASTAETLQAAASRWADQLSGFQAEADALERQAARAAEHQQALQTRQAALPRGSLVLRQDLESASAAVSGIDRQARDLHERYLEAASKTAEEIKPKSLWERTEPVRTVLEAVLAPFDIVAADHWVDALEKAAGQPAEWVAELGNQIEEIKAAMRAGESPVDALIQAGKLAESTGGKIDAWYAFAPGWLKTAAGSLAEIKGLSYTLSGLGLLADAGTIISPQDKGVMGNADRIVAGTNGILIALNMTMDEIPVVGEVTLAATGVYLAGDYLYHHWTPFRDVANEVGHASVKVADGLVHGARSAWHSVTSTIGSWF